MRVKFSELKEGQKFIFSSAFADNSVYRKVTKTTYTYDSDKYNIDTFWTPEYTYVRVCNE